MGFSQLSLSPVHLFHCQPTGYPFRFKSITFAYLIGPEFGGLALVMGGGSLADRFHLDRGRASNTESHKKSVINVLKEKEKKKERERENYIERGKETDKRDKGKMWKESIMNIILYY